MGNSCDRKKFCSSITALILTNTLKTGGAEKQSVYLFNALSERYKTLLVVYYGTQKDQRMLDLLQSNYRSNVIFLSGTHWARLTYIFNLFKDSINPVCISYLATTNTINAVLGKVAGVHIRIGGIRSSEHTWFKKVLQRHLHNFWLNHSVFNNHVGLQKLTEAGFNRSKASVIHNAVDIPELEENNHKTITIISVGRFVEAKDYLTSLAAVKIVSLNSLPFKYIIIGQGELEGLIKSQIVSLEIESIVEVVINPDSIDQYYRSSNIYLSTSVFEGLSNSIMEAMSFGLPVVATDVGDNKYLVKDGETGFLTKVKDVETIASKLEQLINDVQLRNTMGTKGRQHIIENFSMEKFTKQYIELIERLSNES